jgi:hypothetical protein
MKIISIGDIHGRPYWNNINPDNYDVIIFNGDYVDSYTFDNEHILSNLMKIIDFKKDFPEKVNLNLGNHDLPYMWNYATFPCSGFRAEIYFDLHDLFYDNKDLFQVAHQIGNHIWTHAGISNGWFRHNIAMIDQYAEKFETKNLAETLNIIAWTKDNTILHQVSDYRGGDSEYGGITWADRRETRNNYLKGYHQIVGHTPIDEITLYGDEKESIRYIDVLGRVEWQEEKKAEYYKKYKDVWKGELPITMFYECEL